MKPPGPERSDPLRAVSIHKMHVPELLPESQLPANYCSVSVCPAIITDAAPLPIQEYLNPSLLGAFSIHQPHRRPCSRKQMGCCKQKHQSVRYPEPGFFRKRRIPDISKLKKKKKKKKEPKSVSIWRLRPSFHLCDESEDYIHINLFNTYWK